MTTILEYKVEVNEEIYGSLENLLELLDTIVEDELGAAVLRSKLETPDEICGEWEE